MVLQFYRRFYAIQNCACYCLEFCWYEIASGNHFANYDSWWNCDKRKRKYFFESVGYLGAARWAKNEKWATKLKAKLRKQVGRNLFLDFWTYSYFTGPIDLLVCLEKIIIYIFDLKVRVFAVIAEWNVLFKFLFYAESVSLVAWKCQPVSDYFETTVLETRSCRHVKTFQQFYSER